MFPGALPATSSLINPDSIDRVKNILADVKTLAAEYYKLTGKPLGVTGEVAEYTAAQLLGLDLAPPRTEGYDATRVTSQGMERIQIKARCLPERPKPGQRIGRIKLQASCDKVLLVILDIATLDAREIWEARYDAVLERLQRPGSKARERGALGMQEFKAIAVCIWRRAAR